MKHELWKQKDGCYTFCLGGKLGDQARSFMEDEAKLIWTVDADSYFEAMTKYYKFMEWGEYTSEFEQDKENYPDEWVETQN